MLTDVKCRNAKPGEKPVKLADSLGLYLFVTKTGFKSWRFKYRQGGKEHRLIFGPYPEVSLLEARDLRDAARRQLRAGINPGVDRKQRRAESKLAADNTFEAIARRWHQTKVPHWADRYARQVLERFENDVFPAIGSVPIASVTVPMVLNLLRDVQSRRALETAHRLRQHMSEIFSMAIGAGIASADPAIVVKSALLTPVKGRRPAVRLIKDARAVLAAVEKARAYRVTWLASRLLALTAARPGVLRIAAPGEFEDLDGEAPIWRIPAAKMKLTAAKKADLSYEFIIPLAPQAVDVVKAALELFGTGPLLFPSTVSVRRPMSDSTLSKLYREAGYQGVHVPHGWRSTFSTIMNERAALKERIGDRQVIDLMLAHVPQHSSDVSRTEIIYNRAMYMGRRREIAVEWADLLMAGAQGARQLAQLD